MNNDLPLFNVQNNISEIKIHESKYSFVRDISQDKLFSYYNKINSDKEHLVSNDDICTPMECVKTMLDYIPDSFWKNKNIKVLDPCCGNGNFGAYCMTKTSIDNIWFNDINQTRLENCKKLLNPKNIMSINALNITSYYSWDLIMANPPYSGGGNKNKSLSNEFIEHSISLLKNGGFLCFVTPNNWMTYNNNNMTLKKLLSCGSFLVIDNDAKKFFPQVGSSFTIFVWQKNVFDNTTFVKNTFLQKDEQYVKIPKDLNFIPLYLSQVIINIIKKATQSNENKFTYRCDLHNHTRKDLLSDIQDDKFKYETIHTPKKTRYACVKQDIYDKWTIIIPLSTYYLPYIKHNVNVTQSVGYFSFDTKEEAELYLKQIQKKHFKLLIHITRYGNFNNIMVLKHISFDKKIRFTKEENKIIAELSNLIKY